MMSPPRDFGHKWIRFEVVPWSKSKCTRSNTNGTTSGDFDIKSAFFRLMVLSCRGRAVLEQSGNGFFFGVLGPSPRLKRERPTVGKFGSHFLGRMVKNLTASGELGLNLRFRRNYVVAVHGRVMSETLTL
jgi:hypothetical protein